MKVGLVAKGHENLGMEYVSAVLKKNRHIVFPFLEPDIFGSTDNVIHLPRINKMLCIDKIIVESILKSRPHILGFSVYTPQMPWAIKIASEVKKKADIPIVFGGIHPTLTPETVLKNKCVDFVVRGEGEFPFLELVQSLEKKASPKSIPNLAFRVTGGIQINPLREPINLDTLPLIDKQLFRGWVDHSDYLLTAGRGCPFSCSYCCESYLNKCYDNKYYRKRSVESVINELAVMKKRFRFKRVYFFDPIFFSDKNWLLMLLKEYRRKIGVPFKCEGHVKFLDKETAVTLKKSKCYGMDIGIQTMNERARRDVLNRFETNEDYRKGFAICDRVGLKYDIDHLFGIPGETEQDYLDSAKFYSGLRRLNRIKVFYLTYFPKTPIIDAALEKKSLSQGEVIKIQNGEMMSYNTGGSVNQQLKNNMMNYYEKVFRALPIIPFSIRKRVFTRRRSWLISHMPKVLIYGMQTLKGIFSGDFRFIFYIKRYMRLIPRVLHHKL